MKQDTQPGSNVAITSNIVIRVFSGLHRMKKGKSHSVVNNVADRINVHVSLDTLHLRSVTQTQFITLAFTLLLELLV